MTQILILPLFLSFIICFSFTPLTILLARKLKLVDDPKLRPHPAHTHKGAIPRAGGLPLYLGIITAVFVFTPVNLQVAGILLGGLILVLIGIWDDIKDRSPYIRFLANILAGILVITSGIGIPYTTNPLGGIIEFHKLNIPFFPDQIGISLLPLGLALIWIVWTTNIVGWSGGVDGQMPGVVAISALVIGILSLRYSLSDPSLYYVTCLSFITAGSYLGFLPWNFYPQKIMPGYGGKSLGGFMLAVLSILSFSKLGTALLVLAVPMTDAIFIFAKRILSGKSPVWASKGHLHHQLLKIGWSRRKIAVFYWTISLLMGIIALTLSSKQKLFTAFLVVIIIFGLIIWLNYFKSENIIRGFNSKRKFSRKGYGETFSA